MPGPPFIKRQDVLPTIFLKSGSREIECYDAHIALKFEKHISNAAADLPVKFQSN